jgi:hypothetical protein
MHATAAALHHCGLPLLTSHFPSLTVIGPTQTPLLRCSAVKRQVSPQQRRFFRRSITEFSTTKLLQSFKKCAVRGNYVSDSKRAGSGREQRAVEHWHPSDSPQRVGPACKSRRATPKVRLRATPHATSTVFDKDIDAIRQQRSDHLLSLRQVFDTTFESPIEQLTCTEKSLEPRKVVTDASTSPTVDDSTHSNANSCASALPATSRSVQRNSLSTSL